MRWRRLYAFVLLATSGGLLFQTTPSCTEQVATSLVSTLGDTLVNLIVQMVVSGLTGQTTAV